MKSEILLSFKYGLEVGAGVISGDSFPNPVRIMLHNHTNITINIPKHTLVAHLLIIPVLTPEVTEIHADVAVLEHVEEVEDTEDQS
uniref:dUTP diphosphatase n=1 Tax=Pithovirus LCPAC403 TaxID=2506596 RepID=A0A481ZCL3_9VIRU|nr:MAG: dUTP diphosphatase [Pithovirus LCPAC403]